MIDSPTDNPHGGFRAGAGRKPRGIVRLHLSPLASVVESLDRMVEEENARRVEADGENAVKCTRTEMFEIVMQERAARKARGKQKRTPN